MYVSVGDLGNIVVGSYFVDGDGPVVVRWTSMICIFSETLKDGERRSPRYQMSMYDEQPLIAVISGFSTRLSKHSARDPEGGKQWLQIHEWRALTDITYHKSQARNWRNNPLLVTYQTSHRE